MKMTITLLIPSGQRINVMKFFVALKYLALLPQYLSIVLYLIIRLLRSVHIPSTAETISNCVIWHTYFPAPKHSSM